MRFRPLFFPMLALAAIAAAALASVALPPTTANANPTISKEICLTDTDPCQDRLLMESWSVRYLYDYTTEYLSFRYVGNNHLWVKRSELSKWKYLAVKTDKWRRAGPHGPDNIVSLHHLGQGIHWFAVRDASDGRLLAQPKSVLVNRAKPALDISKFGVMYNGPYELWYRRYGQRQINAWMPVEKGAGDISKLYLPPHRYYFALRDPSDGRKLIWRGAANILWPH